MKKISSKISLIIIGCACLAVALCAYISLSLGTRILQQEAEEKLTWISRQYAAEFSQELLIIEDQVAEIAVHVKTTIDSESLKNDPTYLARYEDELAEYLYSFAKNRSSGNAAWCYFNPELSTESHDVYFADGNKDQIPDRQAHIPLEYYDNTPTPTDDKYWWYGPVETGELCWTNPYEWTLLDGDVIKVASCAQPIFIDGELIAVVGTYYHFDTMRSDIDAIKVYSDGYASLMNEKLDFIIHPTFFSGTRYTSENLATVQDGAFANIAHDVRENPYGITTLGQNGSERLVAYSHLSNGWIMAINPLVADVYAGLHKLVQTLILAALGCLLISILIAWRMGRYIAKPFLAMAEGCKQLGAGDFSTRIATNAKDETKILGDSLNEMAENIETLNQELVSLAYYDTLTKMPNKHFFEKTAKTLLQKQGGRFAYAIFDINKFKLINDIFGLEYGDLLLKHIAQQLTQDIAQDELAARFNADHFHLLLHYTDKEALKERLTSLIEGIYRFKFEFHAAYKISGSFGIYIVEDRQVSVSSMGDKARLALNKVKGLHNVTMNIYNDSIGSEIMKEQEIENAMEAALKNNEFQMYLQPKYDILKHKIVGAEALVRWHPPEGGIIPPNNFIPIFEKNGFIANLDLFMLKRVCAFLRKRLDDNLPVFSISINQSRQYLNHENYLSSFLKIVNFYNIPHNLIELEITETAFFENQEEMIEIVQKLKDLGFLVSMDDFGSGYSSLNMLQDIMVDILKLDRIFFRESINTQRGQKIIENIISMAKELNIVILAEGIETKEQVQFLLQTSCHLIQGFYFSKPIPADEFEALYEENQNAQVD